VREEDVRDHSVRLRGVQVAPGAAAEVREVIMADSFTALFVVGTVYFLVLFFGISILIKDAIKDAKEEILDSIQEVKAEGGKQHGGQ
jgi:hypothetical protein